VKKHILLSLILGLFGASCKKEANYTQIGAEAFPRQCGADFNGFTNWDTNEMNNWLFLSHGDVYHLAKHAEHPSDLEIIAFDTGIIKYVDDACVNWDEIFLRN